MLPIVNDRSKVSAALSGVRGVKSKAQEIQNEMADATVDFGAMRKSIQDMATMYLDNVQPLLAFNAAQVQAAATLTFGGNLAPIPAGIRASIVAVQSSLNAFGSAFATIYATLGNVQVFTQATGQFTYITPASSIFAALTTPLANIVTACTALDYED